MSDNTVLLLAGGVALLLIMQKKAATTAAAAPTAPSPAASNVNNQMWQSILGNTWKALLTPASQNDGFVMRNPWGQVVTSDGKPVDSSLPAISGAISNTDYSTGYSGISDSVSTAAPDGSDLLGTLGW